MVNLFPAVLKSFCEAGGRTLQVDPEGGCGSRFRFRFRGASGGAIRPFYQSRVSHSILWRIFLLLSLFQRERLGEGAKRGSHAKALSRRGGTSTHSLLSVFAPLRESFFPSLTWCWKTPPKLDCLNSGLWTLNPGLQKQTVAFASNAVLARKL